MHLTPDQTKAYRERSLPAQERLWAGDHLAECAACRGEVAPLAAAPEPNLAALAHDPAVEPHLAADEMIALQDGKLSEEEETFARAHLQGCARCRAEYAELSRFAAALAEQPRMAHPAAPREPAEPQSSFGDWIAGAVQDWLAALRGWQGLAVAGAVAVVCLLVALWPERNAPKGAIAQTKAPTSAPGIASGGVIQDGAHRILIEPNGWLSVGASLPPAARALLERNSLALATPDATGRGPGDKLLTQRVPPGSSIPSAQRGAPWQAPAPRSSPWQGTAATESELVHFRALAGGSRLAFAFACLERGFYPEAREELRQLQAENRQSPAASQALEELLEAVNDAEANETRSPKRPR